MGSFVGDNGLEPSRIKSSRKVKRREKRNGTGVRLKHD